MVKVRVATNDELAKIEEKLCEAVLETIDHAKRDPKWSNERAKALKRHLYAMTERVLGSVRANVICGTAEGGEKGREVSEREIADPELDALEEEVAELSARVAEQRASEFKVQELANTVWAFATASQPDKKLFATLANAAERPASD